MEECGTAGAIEARSSIGIASVQLQMDIVNSVDVVDLMDSGLSRQIFICSSTKSS
jgi:ABC-type molybdenum transport system ATPase subunit/photorepair protein PhrA